MEMLPSSSHPIVQSSILKVNKMEIKEMSTFNQKAIRLPSNITIGLEASGSHIHLLQKKVS